MEINNKESRWHRPDLYWTIAGLFLIISFTILILDLAWAWHNLTDSDCGAGIGICPSVFGVPLAITAIIIFGTPTIIGSVRLFLRHKNAIVPVIIPLALYSIYFCLYAGSRIIVASYYYRYSIASYLSLLVLDVIIIVFVIIGWKKMFKGSKSHPPQNNSLK
jgi:hypothetical protein